MSLVRVATAVAALAVVLAPGAAAQARGSTANGPTQQTAAAAESTDTTDTTAAVPPILAQRRDVTVTSFDGTGIAAHVFPAPGLVAGATAPTVLTPPGWGQPGYTDPATARRFTDQGYNVVTWDPRGFGTSGGTVEFNSPAIEGRDTSAIIDWVATQPWAQLDRPGDPRVGMSGGSYGGSIQYSTAANDHRLDALVPTVGWFSLATSLYKNNTVKQAWFDSLYMGGYGAAAEVPPGLDPQLAAGFVNGSRTGVLTPAEISWLAERGPGSAAENITTPTMIIGGTVDTLFPLDEQIELYRTIRKGGAPVKMVWMCGGHGICSTGIGDPGDTEVHSLSFDSKYVAALTDRWFDRYLRKKDVDTGPGFEWLSDDATWRWAERYPAPAAAPITATGAGQLTLVEGYQSSGDSLEATPAGAGEALQIAVTAPRPAQIVGPPRLTLTYQGQGAPADARVYAQLVDDERGIVVDGQVTPIPLVLDGSSHTADIEMYPIAVTAATGTRYTLQIISSSRLWAPQRGTGTITVTRASLTLPTVTPDVAAPAGSSSTRTWHSGHGGLVAAAASTAAVLLPALALRRRARRRASRGCSGQASGTSTHSS